MGVGEPPGGNSGSVLYEDWLQVQPGEDYYLLINNFSNTNSGFSIQFTGQIFQTNPDNALDCSIISNLLGPPIAACDTENVQLDATTSNALAYTWYQDNGNGFQIIPGATGPTQQAAQSALYRVEVVTPSGTIFSDVQVGFSPAPSTFALSDETVCTQNGYFDLTVKDKEALGPQDPDQYLVSYHRTPGDANSGLNPLPGNYALTEGIQTIFVRTVSVANARCHDSSQQFNLTVAEPPVLDFPTSVPICENSGTVTIGDITPNPDYIYAWDSGEQTAAITVSGSGSYTVSVTNLLGGPQCTETLTIQVEVSLSPEITDIIISDLGEQNSVEVVTGVAGNFEYRLDSGLYQESNLFSDVPAGQHTVTVRDLQGCGLVSENILVMGHPKFFTPNGDGNNDLWHIEGIQLLDSPLVFIYDRFGKLIRQLDVGSPGWDGTYRGMEMPSSDYWFRLTYIDPAGQRTEARYLSSHFSLKR
jgi:gliding motility-associated-like protein